MHVDRWHLSSDGTIGRWEVSPLFSPALLLAVVYLYLIIEGLVILTSEVGLLAIWKKSLVLLSVGVILATVRLLGPYSKAYLSICIATLDQQSKRRSRSHVAILHVFHSLCERRASLTLRLGAT